MHGGSSSCRTHGVQPGAGLEAHAGSDTESSPLIKAQHAEAGSAPAAGDASPSAALMTALVVFVWCARRCS
jgi:hypothetical protein